MTDEADYGGPFTRSPRRVRFVELSGGAMSALLDGDLSEAGRVAGVSLTEYFVTDRARWLWRLRLDQMAADPGRARWMVRQAVVGDNGLVVGHAGFHGPPDEAGMVEIGYSIAPDFRRRGYARSALTELLRRAAAEAARDKLAQDVLAFDVSDQLAITDVFLLCSASNDRQVKAIQDAIEEKLLTLGAKPIRREGEREGRWVLLDFSDIVVHIQHSEERVYYALERLWSDCPIIDLPVDAPAAE